MSGELQNRRDDLGPKRSVEYGFSSAARIRRELLSETLDGRDYYGDCFALLELKGDERILNVGSGDGLDEVRLATEFGHRGEIIGIDLPSLDDELLVLQEGEDESVLYQQELTPGEAFYCRFVVAEQLLRERGISNVRFMPGDAEKLDFEDNSFDVVIWNGSGYYFSDITAALLQTHRVLKPGGTFMNLTNGRGNKPKHHQAVARIKRQLGIDVHEPLSARFTLQAAAPLILRHFELAVPILQETTYRIALERKPVLRGSVDTYREGIGADRASGWSAARDRVFAELIDPEFESSGEFRDQVQRGGGKYVKSPAVRA